MGEKNNSHEQQSKKDPTTSSRSSRHNGQNNIKKEKVQENKTVSTGKQTKQKRQKKRQKEDRLVRRIVLVLVVALLVVGTILGYSSYKYVRSSLKPLDSENSDKVAIEVPIGSSNKMIGEILEKNHIIKSGLVFNYYTKFNNYSDFQAGQYAFSPDMTLEAISESFPPP